MINRSIIILHEFYREEKLLIAYRFEIGIGAKLYLMLKKKKLSNTF